MDLTNDYYLHKEFFYRSRKSLAEFFRENSFWEELLNLFGQVDYFGQVDEMNEFSNHYPLDFLNEVRWRCVFMSLQDMHLLEDKTQRDKFLFRHMGKPKDSVILHAAFKTFKAYKKVKENPPVWLSAFEEESNGWVRKKAEWRGAGPFFQLIENASIFNQTWDFDFSACPEVPEYIYLSPLLRSLGKVENFEVIKYPSFVEIESILSLYTDKWERTSMFLKLYAWYKSNAVSDDGTPTYRTYASGRVIRPMPSPPKIETKEPKKEIPEIFQTDEAKELLEKLRQAKWLDEKYQPVRLSNSQKGVIVVALLKRLDKFNVNTQWQLVCEGLWGMQKYDSIRVAYKQVYGDNLKSPSRQHQKFQEKVEQVLED